MATKLNPKQALFCKEYIVDLNATQAAIRAGYSEKTAGQIGDENLKKPKIAEEIERLKAERVERVEVKADDVLRELVRISQSDIRKVFNEDGSLKAMSEWPDAIAACVASVEIEELFEWEINEDNGKKEKRHIGFTKKVKFWDKNKSLEMLGRHMKLFGGDDDGKKGPNTILIQNGEIFKLL